MGGQLSSLVFQPDEQSSYTKDLEGLIWIETNYAQEEDEKENNNDRCVLYMCLEGGFFSFL